jgi:hypothetical protein
VSPAEPRASAATTLRRPRAHPSARVAAPLWKGSSDAPTAHIDARRQCWTRSCSFRARRAAERHAVGCATTAVAAAAGARSPWLIVGGTPFPVGLERPPDRSRAVCSSALPRGFSGRPQPCDAGRSSGDRLGRTVRLVLPRQAVVARASVGPPLPPLFPAVPGLHGHFIAPSPGSAPAPVLGGDRALSLSRDLVCFLRDLSSRECALAGMHRISR